MKLLIGWAEESIVPEKKVSLFGQFYERISDYVESQISVTAMAVQSGEEQLILVSADVVGVSKGILRLARQKLSALCPDFDVKNLVVAATHTHTSLKMADPDADRSGSSVVILEEFLPKEKMYRELVTADETVLTPQEATAFFTDKVALAAKRAWENRSEALYTNEFGRAAVGMCRRVSYDDGTGQMWGDTNTANFVALEGGNDSGIELLYTFDADKKLTGIVANIACPAQILEQHSFISADYWGRTKENLRKQFGDNIYLLGLVGAAGDQCPRDLVRWVNPEQPIRDPNVKRPNYIRRKADPSMYDISGCNKVGKRIANEITLVFDEITQLQQDGIFRHKVIDLALPLRKASITEYKNAVREIKDYVAQNQDKEAFDYVDNARMYIYAGIIRRYRKQQFEEVYPIECHVIRLGNIAMVTNPFELFLDYGNRIKARSLAEQTFIIQLCCGSGGYLPTEKAEQAGHYSAYISSGNVGHEGGDLLVRNTLSEIKKLWEL